VLTQLSIPSAPEIEMLVLGAMMSSEKNLESALDELTEKDFTTVANICIFRAILSCAKNEIAVDCHTVTQAILDSGSLRLLPSNSYIIDCIQSSYIDIEIASKCQILKDKAAHRALLLAHNSTTALLSKPIENITDAIEQVRQLFFKIDLPRGEERLSLGEIAKADLEKTKANYKTYLELGHVPKAGLDTGFTELDKIIDMAPGNLVIVAARPGVGKTAFALNMLYQQGCEMKIPSVFFSLEMSNQEIYRRLLSIHTRIPQSRLKSCELSESEIRKIEEAAIYFGDCPVYLYDITEPRISDIRAKCRRLKESSDVKVVFYRLFTTR
jgi:replicative DNA helicase